MIHKFPADSTNLARLRKACGELQAEPIAVPPLNDDLKRGSRRQSWS
jgi:hypothetical protein